MCAMCCRKRRRQAASGAGGARKEQGVGAAQQAKLAAPGLSGHPAPCREQTRAEPRAADPGGPGPQAVSARTPGEQRALG